MPGAGGLQRGRDLRRPRWSPAAFVAGETRGTWGTAGQISGTSAFRNVSVSVMSCSSAGNCTVGGFAGLRAFVLRQVNGRWRAAQVLSGAATLSKARLDILTVARGSPTPVPHGGEPHLQAVVVSVRQ